jgi:hypothetical protein
MAAAALDGLMTTVPGLVPGYWKQWPGASGSRGIVGDP